MTTQRNPAPIAGDIHEIRVQVLIRKHVDRALCDTAVRPYTGTDLDSLRGFAFIVGRDHACDTAGGE